MSVAMHVYTTDEARREDIFEVVIRFLKCIIEYRKTLLLREELLVIGNEIEQ